jgi:hypothetical protein
MGIANLACFAPLYILQSLLVRDAFRAGPVALGVLYAASGAGGVLSSLVAARHKPLRPVTTIWVTWAMAGTFASLVGLSPWLWMSCAFTGVTWGLVTYGNILWFPLIQRETPPQLLGRVSSVDWLFSLAFSPLGIIAAGIAAGTIGVRLTMIVGGTIAAATGGVLLIPGATDPDKRAAEGRTETTKSFSS